MFDNARQTLTAALAENEFDSVAHFPMGELWLADKGWVQARREFRIAYSIQPTGLSAAGRMSIALANEFQNTGERELRLEALQYARAYLQRPREEGAEAVQEVLLEISGRWVTGAGGEYVIQSAGRSGIYNFATRSSSGYLRKTAPKSLKV